MEHERKFLVTGNFRKHAEQSMRISQGYLSSVPERTVRVRRLGDKAYLTVKGAGNTSGVSRFEWEIEISPADADALLSLCEPGTIDKTRYYVPERGHQFEVDEFHGANEGLLIAEVEVASEFEEFHRPDWLGAEVTGDARYYNAMLARHPYSTW